MMQKKPFFSICIPSYNSVDLLNKLIQSILKQTFKNIEIIISDDSTNEEVWDFYKSLNDKRVAYFKHKSLINPTENWNSALKRAKGKFRILVHHDDYFSDDFTLEKIYNESQKNGESMVYFLGFINENNFRKFYYGKFLMNQFFRRPDDLLYVNYFSSPSCLVLNQKVDLLYNEDLKWLVDVELYARLFKKYSKIKQISSASMVIGAGNQRVTNTISKKDILSEFYLLKQKWIFKFEIGIYFVQFMKFKIILLSYFNSKLTQISR
jgi:glycosyltransferase involved in cell wall biosynthesis